MAVLLDPEVLAHLEWIGFVQPTGLVVSAPALVRAGAILDRRDAEGQRRLIACLEDRALDRNEVNVPYLPNFRAFAESVLGWSFSAKGYAGTVECPVPTELELPLHDYGEILRPDFVVRDLEPKDGAPPWQLLVNVVDVDVDFDRVSGDRGRFEASAHGRMERLLRHTRVPAGLLFNGRALRLISAPRGENSGWLDFRVADMAQTAGRPITTALRLLLSEQRLLALPKHQRLAALLDDSRKFQNEVSERLAEQVLHALYEFLRGFQAAHDASKGALLHKPLAEHPDEVYRALLTVILRLVFLLYAEERDMLPDDETFLRYYSLAGLYQRLREDAALFPDTLDQRFGAWAQLIMLFRMIYDGAEAGAMHLPQRHGALFDPNRFPFLEGRAAGEQYESFELPLVPDGTIYRALEKLLVLDAERISYRALDVEQIGSVYETMIGFRLETTSGQSVAIKAQKKQGAPTAVNLEALLLEPAAKREKWLQDYADRKLTDTVSKDAAAAVTLEDLHAALLPVIDRAATPDLVAKGAMILQPSEERRRSGSHYTPRALTEPIVRTTLAPILARLRGTEGRPPRPTQILDIKVCDPAMGSGAFLVEACRQLGDELVEAWHAHGEVPAIPTDEDEVIFARRFIAQRCLYGVDRNPVAVDLAKVSLWLVTLAKDHALTFVDHALRHGDSLVGLSRKQIEAFHWAPDAPRFQAGLETMQVREHVGRIAELRRRIREAGESVSDAELRGLWDEAQLELRKVQLFGDLVLAAYFGGEKTKDRERKRGEYASAVVNGETERHRAWLEKWRHADPPLAPFHWEMEFPESFKRENPGFDAVVGNPPFLGGPVLSELFGGPAYQEWLKESNDRAFGNADLAAYFFRRAFAMISSMGSLGLLATKSIAEGSTRVTGLKAILSDGGTIYEAKRSLRWPGQASVIVAVVHIAADKLTVATAPRLDNKTVRVINSRLHPSIESPDPVSLSSNELTAFMGAGLRSSGFILTPAEYRSLAQNKEHLDCLMPLLGGEEVNRSPTQSHERYAINFGSRSLEESAQYPALLDIVRARVKPDRDRQKDHGPGLHGKKYWWQYALRSDPLYDAIRPLSRCLVTAITTSHLGFSFQPIRQVFAHSLVVFSFERFGPFACLQSQVHVQWAQLLSSSLGGTLRYSVSDAFQTFPFPKAFDTDLRLEAAGRACYEFRADLMVRHNEGLTKTYNRFHDPDERDQGIVKLRELHAAMDRAVLDAYGWSDIPTEYEFLLEREIDEDELGDKKKRYRNRWPVEVRDEVLARLLELNAELVKEEARSGDAAKRSKRAGKKSTLLGAIRHSSTKELFS